MAGFKRSLTDNQEALVADDDDTGTVTGSEDAGNVAAGSDTAGAGAGNSSASDLVSGVPGTQVSFNMSSSVSSKTDESFSSKTRYGGAGQDFGYEEYSDTDNSTEKSDSSVSLALGTEQNEFTATSSSSNHTDTSVSHTVWHHLQHSSGPADQSGQWEVFESSTVGSSSHEYSVTLGGSEGVELTDDSSYDVTSSTVDEQHWLIDGVHAAYLTKERYRDYSEADDGSDDDDDDDDDGAGTEAEANDPRVHIVTQQYLGYYDDTIYVVYMQVPGVESTTAGTSGGTGNDPPMDAASSQYEPGFWAGYWHYLTNPSQMDDDLETGFYASLGVAGAAGGAAAAVAWGPAALVATTELTLPTMAWVPGGTVLADGTIVLSGAGTIVAGTTTVTVTGAQVATAAGALGGWSLYSKLQEVDIRRLQTPNSRPYADAAKLKGRGHLTSTNIRQHLSGLERTESW